MLTGEFCSNSRTQRTPEDNDLPWRDLPFQEQIIPGSLCVQVSSGLGRFTLTLAEATVIVYQDIKPKGMKLPD